MIFVRHSLHVLFFLLSCSVVFGQTKEEIKERADKLFENEQYVVATKDYLHLLSLEPLDHNLNFRYGACLLFNSNKKDQALRYLNYAIQSDVVDPRAHYFRGKAFHLNFQFEEAKKSYQAYAQKSGGKKDKRYPVDREMEMCENGKRLLASFTDIVVADKKEIDQTKFFRIYADSRTIGGDILVSEQFQSKLDKKLGHVPVIHFAPNAKAIYYASYGETGTTGLDIYIRRRLPDGKWGDPQLLPGGVNTDEDENFPYIHPDGRSLYFSSRGHNSMGGYDVFRSEFNEESGSFGSPENVDFAISSPDDDLFYVVDSLYQNAYFASARQSQDGKLHVYQVKVSRVPVMEVIVIGNFLSEINPQNKAMQISVKSHASGSVIGEIKSNAEGKYSFVFPKGGKYEYLITVQGSKEQYKFLLEIPFPDEFRPLKQKIVHLNEGGVETVKLINLFDERVDGSDPMLAEIIREKSKLDVNIDNFDLKQLGAEQKQKELLASLGFGDMKLVEVNEAIDEKLQVQIELAEKVEQVNANIENELVAKADRIEDLNTVEKELISQINKTEDPVVKYKLLNEAERKANEKETLIETVLALNELRGDVRKESGLDKDRIAEMSEFSEKLKQFMESGNDSAALTLLSENTALVKELNQASTSNLMQQYLEKTKVLRSELQSLKQTESTYDKSIEGVNSEIFRLESQLQEAKKKDVETLQASLTRKKEELTLLQSEQDKVRTKIDLTNKKISKIEMQIISLQHALEAEEFVAEDPKKVEESVKEVNEIGEESTAFNYEEQKDVLERDYPELVGEVTNSEFAEIKKSYETKSDVIESDQNSTSLERLYDQQSNVKSTLSAVEERINTIQSSSEQNPAAVKELSALTIFKEDLITENNTLNERILALRKDTPDVARTVEDLVYEIDPEFETGMAAINDNQNLSEKERLTQQQELTEIFKTKLEANLTEVETQLTQDPENSEAEIRKAMLVDVIADQELKSKQLEAALATIATAELAQQPEPIPIAELDPEFEARKERIASDSSKTPLERNEELIKEHEKLIAKVDAEQKRTEKELKKAPNNAELQAKQKSLNLLEELLNDEIAEYTQEKEALSKAVVADFSVTPEEVLKALDPEYEEQKQALTARSDLSEVEQERQLIALDKALLVKLNEEQEKLTSQLAKDPEDRSLSSRNEIVNELIASTEASIKERDANLLAMESESNPGEDVRDRLISELDPTFESKQKTLQGAKELNANLELISNQETWVKLLEDRGTKTSDPAEKAELTKMLAEAQDQLRGYVANAETLNESDKSQLINALDPQYSEEIKALQAAGDKDRLIERERELQTALRAKIETLAERTDPRSKVELKHYELLLEESSLREANWMTTDPVVVQNSESDRTRFLESVDAGFDRSTLSSEYTSLNELKEQEAALQSYEQNLLVKLDQIERDIAKNPGSDLSTKKQWITEELERTREKQRKVKIGIGELEQIADRENKNPEQLNQEKNDFLKSVDPNFDRSELEAEYNTANELSEQERRLKQYEDNLLAQKSTLAERLVSSNDPELVDQQQWIEEALKTVVEKRRKVSIALGELEQVKDQQAMTESERRLQVLKSEQETIESRLENQSLTAKERKVLENQLEENEAAMNQISYEQNSMVMNTQEKQIQNEIAERKNDPENRENEIVAQGITYLEQAQNRIQAEQEILDKAKSPEEKNYIASSIVKEQEELLTLNSEIEQEATLASLEKEYDLRVYNQVELEQKKRNFTIKIGELSNEILRTESQLAEAKKADIPLLQEQVNTLKAERDLYMKRLAMVDDQLATMEEPAHAVHPDALKEVVNYSEERRIASGDEYKTYADAANKALRIEDQMRNFEEELALERKALIALVREEGTDLNDDAVKLQAEKIKTLQADLDRLKIELVQAKWSADQLLTDKEDAMKMQNLVKRGVKPIEKVLVATALLNLPVNGFSIDTTAESNYSVAKPIPVDVMNPKGLVYRVQVGAFARPIPQDLFGSFNPVSGEKVEGSNIVRYMAGFFNNASDVVNAREQIRSLGYSDAFVVAYCDGQRIGFGEARRREAEGTCVPKGANEIMVEVAENTAAKMGIPLVKELDVVPETAYNQAPGAAPADPIEKMEGLFFTVQIGVFNRPVEESYLFGMTQILTFRLPNGQIRYSSGIFNSVAEAMSTRDQALSKGVKGAFITAYYKGERIPLNKAQSLLDEFGDSILQSKMKSGENDVIKTPVPVVDTNPKETIPPVSNEPVSEINELRVQVVSKKTFDEFPRDVLNRYNAEGSFFYDEHDKRVKSIVYKNEDYLPRLYNFRNDVDTVYLPAGALDDENKQILELKTKGASIPGDVMDWLLRFNYRREITPREGYVQIRLFGIETEKAAPIMNQINAMGVSVSILEEEEFELELENNEK